MLNRHILGLYKVPRVGLFDHFKMPRDLSSERRETVRLISAMTKKQKTRYHLYARTVNGWPTDEPVVEKARQGS